MAFCPSKPNISRGKPLKSQSREIVYNVAQYFITKKLEDVKKGNHQRYDIRDLIGSVTGVSAGTVSNILREAKNPSNDPLGTPSFKTPRKNKIAHRKRINTEDVSDVLIRDKIHEFYLKKQCPTVKALRKAMVEDGMVDCSFEYLRNRILGCGFKWVDCGMTHKILIERPEIAARRAEYLRNVNNLRAVGSDIVYIGETYVQEPPRKVGKNKTLVIVHAGGEMGFVQNALMIFSASITSGDHHSCMNLSVFSEWVQELLLPNLPPGCVIIMDDAKHRSVQLNKKPSAVSLTADIVEWLCTNNVGYDQNMTKAELLMLSKNTPMKKRYVVDEMFAAKGHRVVRIPPYHPDLNPIEQVWREIKTNLDERFADSSLSDKEVHLKKIISSYTAENWKIACERVCEVEANYRKRDPVVEDEIDSIIVAGGENSDFSDDSSDSD